MARVVELHCYPVKGCAGMSMSTATMTPAGLANDRSFMVISTEGVFRSQRRDPRLALIRPEISSDRLTLRAEGMETVHVDVNTTAARRLVRLFHATYAGIDQGDTAAEWISEVIGVPSRLVRVPPEHDRLVEGRTQGTSGYADSSPVHLTTVASLAALNERIAAKGSPPVPMSRMRPNIVVDGWAEPHVEDRVNGLVIGETELAYSKLAIRCAVTMVDQHSSAKTGPEPLRTLADYRRARQGGVAFGVKFAVVRIGKLSVGDEVEVTSWSESEL